MIIDVSEELNFSIFKVEQNIKQGKKWYRFIYGEGSDLGAYSFIIKMEAECSFKKTSNILPDYAASSVHTRHQISDFLFLFVSLLLSPQLVQYGICSTDFLFVVLL
jgi:hypothetical protein